MVSPNLKIKLNKDKKIGKVLFIVEGTVSGLLKALDEINDCKYDLDDFSQCNEDVFEYEEKIKKESDTYKCLSLFVICLIDLGLIEFE